MKNEKYFETKLNNKELIKELSDISEKFEDIRPLLRRLKQSMLHFIDENFESEGKESGNKWQEWSESYKEKRRKEDKIGKILSYNGDLRNDILGKVSKYQLIIGSPSEYAAIHNFGATEPDKNGRDMNIPQREFFRFADWQIENLIGEIKYWYLVNTPQIKMK